MTVQVLQMSKGRKRCKAADEWASVTKEVLKIGEARKRGQATNAKAPAADQC